MTSPQSETTPGPNWYYTEDNEKRLHQVVLSVAPGQETQSRFATLWLAAKYKDLVTLPAATGLFRLEDDPGPYLMIRTDGQVEEVTKAPITIALSFFRGASGGIFCIYVYVDSDRLRDAMKKRHPFLEMGYGLDLSDGLQRIRDFLSGNRINLVFADKSASTCRFVDPDTGQKDEGAAPQCKYDKVVSLDPNCQEVLRAEFAALLDYHSSVPRSRRDFRHSMQELWNIMPVASSPVLPVHAEAKDAQARVQKAENEDSGSTRACRDVSCIGPKGSTSRRWWLFWIRGEQVLDDKTALRELLGNDFMEVTGATYASLDGLARGSRKARAFQRRAVQVLHLPLEVRARRSGVVFRLIPAGVFHMGSEPWECPPDLLDDERRHRVELTRPFYCGKFEVTQGQWEVVMGYNPSSFQDGGKDAPVENVNWHYCQAFAKRLCEMEGVSEGTYRLLTETEWEYACRAGTKTPFCYGNEIDSTMANFDGREPFGRVNRVRKSQFRGTTLSVGSFAPNAWGLYDMHGNVCEWCHDYRDDYTMDAAADPVGDTPDSFGVLRGGCYRDGGWACRSAYRHKESPMSHDLHQDRTLPENVLGHFGLRLARIIPPRK